MVYFTCGWFLLFNMGKCRHTRVIYIINPGSSACGPISLVEFYVSVDPFPGGWFFKWPPISGGSSWVTNGRSWNFCLNFLFGTSSRLKTFFPNFFMKDLVVTSLRKKHRIFGCFSNLFWGCKVRIPSQRIHVIIVYLPTFTIKIN